MTAYALRTAAAKHLNRANLFDQCADDARRDRSKAIALLMVKAAALLELDQ